MSISACDIIDMTRILLKYVIQRLFVSITHVYQYRYECCLHLSCERQVKNAIRNYALL